MTLAPGYTRAATPTRYGDVVMDSQLETGFAMWADHIGLEWSYHPSPVASKWGIWRLDFEISVRLCMCEGMPFEQVPVEVKPHEWLRANDHVLTLGRRMRAAGIALLATPEVLLLSGNRLDSDRMPTMSGDEVPYWWVVRALPFEMFERDDNLCVWGLTLDCNSFPWRGEWWKGETE